LEISGGPGEARRHSFDRRDLVGVLLAELVPLRVVRGQLFLEVDDRALEIAPLGFERFDLGRQRFPFGADLLLDRLGPTSGRAIIRQRLGRRRRRVFRAQRARRDESDGRDYTNSRSYGWILPTGSGTTS
jgi:hypothetical protein